jgi:small-conductance mechanosensitive channel
MTPRGIMSGSCAAFAVFVVLLSPCAIAVGADTSPSPSPAPSGTSPATLTESVSELSAQRAAAERSQMYRAGADYGRWLDGLAKKSDNAFLQTPVYDRVTWMRLLACIITLGLLGLIAGWFLWIVRRRAGEIQSRRAQSWLELSASATRKPLVLFVSVFGGAIALMPIVTGVASRPTRLFWAGTITAIVYAGEIIALLWLVFRAARAVEKRMQLWAERTNSVLGRVVVPITGHTLRLSVPLLGVILLLPLLKLPADWAWVTQKGFGLLFIVTLSFLLIRGINAVQLALLSRYRMDAEDNLSARRVYTQVSVIRKVIVTAIVIIGTGSSLMLFDPVRQFGTSILASAGIAGVVIGFAAQKTLGNVLAGIQIALTQPLLIDDIVVVEGEFGQIEEITLTYVTVRTWDLRRIVLPITYFVEKPFQNWSRVSTELLGTVILYLDYQAPMAELRKELKRLVENHPKWDKKVCGLQVTDSKQSTIEVRALVSSTNSGKLFDLRCDVREGLIEFLRHKYPESLPKVRNVTPEDLAPESHTRTRSGTATGKEHERGDTSPGVHAEDKSDGSNDS